jgi:hypothetical protein
MDNSGLSRGHMVAPPNAIILVNFFLERDISNTVYSLVEYRLGNDS